MTTRTAKIEEPTFPLMPKATAVWLVENSSLSFEQIATFCGLHLLEVQGIADGEVAIGVRGLDPVAERQITREELNACQDDFDRPLSLAIRSVARPGKKTSGPRYTPVAKRQERPDGIAWLLRTHPQLLDAQVIRLVGTTKKTISAIRDRSFWNSANLRPRDPVLLGLCKQSDLNREVATAARRTERAGGEKVVEEQPQQGATLVQPAPESEQVENPFLSDDDPRPDRAPTVEDVFGPASPASKPATESSASSVASVSGTDEEASPQPDASPLPSALPSALPSPLPSVEEQADGSDS